MTRPLDKDPNRPSVPKMAIWATVGVILLAGVLGTWGRPGTMSDLADELRAELASSDSTDTDTDATSDRLRPASLAATDEQASESTQTDPKVTEEFVAAWERSLVGPYALSGTVTVRKRQGQLDESGAPSKNPEPIEVRFRQSRLDDRSIEQLADTVTLTDAEGRRYCHLDGNREFMCTPADQSFDPANMMTAIRAAVTGEYATLVVTELDHEQLFTELSGKYPARQATCWQALAEVPEQRQLWGDAARFCFDNATGAIVVRQTVSDTQTETFLAELISTTVTEADLAPSKGSTIGY